MSGQTCLMEKSRRRRRRRGGGWWWWRGGAVGGILIVAETLPTTKTQRLLKRNHRDPCQSCVLTHTNTHTHTHTHTKWISFQFSVRCVCFPPLASTFFRILWFFMSCFHGITYSLGIMGCRAENVGMWELDRLEVNIRLKLDKVTQCWLLYVHHLKPLENSYCVLK